MKKFQNRISIKAVLSAFAAVLLLIWAAFIAKCEILTDIYGEEFAEFDEVNSAYEYKILNYKDDFARIYCINSNQTNDSVYNYIRENGSQRLNQWESGCRSTNGTADGIVYPYVWHTLKSYLPK